MSTKTVLITDYIEVNVNVIRTKFRAPSSIVLVHATAILSGYLTIVLSLLAVLVSKSSIRFVVEIYPIVQRENMGQVCLDITISDICPMLSFCAVLVEPNNITETYF